MRSENRQGRSRHIPDRRSIQYCGPFNTFKPFNRIASFKSFNWSRQPGQNCRYFTGFAGALTRDVVVAVDRDRINAVLVARVPGELSRFDNCQNVKMTAVIAFRSERLPAVEKMIRPLAFAVFLAGLRRV